MREKIPEIGRGKYIRTKESKEKSRKARIEWHERDLRIFKQEDWLYQKYIVDGLAIFEVANLAKCHGDTIRGWLEKFNIRIKTTGEILAGRYVGEKHWNYSRKVSEETKKLMKENHWSRKGGVPWDKGLTKETDDRVAKISERMLGSKNHQYGKRGELCPNYIDGRSSESYGTDFDSGLKFSIRQRDNFICWGTFCRVKENGIAHDVHHTDYDKKNNEWWNLITLCKSCHMKTNWNREFWKKCFKILMEVRDYGYENQIRKFAEIQY